ncbi:PilX N-terminal domain-containing pilus assembly protein [Acinetobacter sp. ANC 5383]
MMNRRSQRGATLIVVLVILLLIMIIGTLAIRQSLVSLNIATNSQAQQLMFENSDTALFKIEDPTQVETQLATNGMFAYFDSDDHKNDQLVFCYNGTNSNFFSLQNASVISSDGTLTKNGLSGYCKSTWFTTGRSAILSQVYLSLISTTSQPLANLTIGTSTVLNTNVPNSTKNIAVTVISVLPSFAAASSTAIENCFKNDKDHVGACFAALNIPYNIQRADYTVGTTQTLQTS